MSYGTHTNESRHTYEWVTSHIWILELTSWIILPHRNELWHTYKWVTAHIRMSHGTHRNESRHTYESFNLYRESFCYIEMSHSTHLDFHVTHMKRHVTHINWSHHTCADSSICTVGRQNSKFVCVREREGLSGCVCWVYLKEIGWPHTETVCEGKREREGMCVWREWDASTQCVWVWERRVKRFGC